MSRALDASFREGLRSPASSPQFQKLSPTRGCEAWRARVPRAGWWWPTAHPNSCPWVAITYLVGSSLGGECGTQSTRSGTPALSWVGMGGLVLADLGPSVMLRSWALLMINTCIFKIM